MSSQRKIVGSDVQAEGGLVRSHGAGKRTDQELHRHLFLIDMVLTCFDCQVYSGKIARIIVS